MLVSAASTAKHRVLVFRVCDDGLCSSDSYLQWLDGWPPDVVHTSRVPELGGGRVVRSVRWERRASRLSLVAEIAPRREGAAPLTLFLLPRAPGSYEVRH